MGWLQSMVVAVLTGVTGMLSAGLVAAGYTQWYAVTSREGAAGYAVVGIAILGGVAGCIMGLAVARLLATGGFWKATACALGLVVGIAAILALLLYVLADIPPRLDGDELRLEVEIRLPAGHAQPMGDGTFTLGSVVAQRQRAARSGDLLVEQARREDGRWILPAQADLFTTRGQRMIMAELGGRTLAAFIVPLPARPGSDHEQWSAWGPQPRSGDPPWPDTQPAYRFRVQRLPRAVPEPAPADIEAQQEADTQAAFEAIPEQAPLAALLAYAQPLADLARRTLALQRITARPGWVEELGALMLDADPHQAQRALLVVPGLEQPPAELLVVFAAATRDLLARMRAFNDTPPEDDPDMHGAGDVSIRFGAWVAAARALRASADGDFSAELGEILALSRVREDSRAMQSSVRHAASHYLQTWTGTAPLPGDRPP